MLVFSLQYSRSQPNLVPNPGFEHIAINPDGWFYKGEDFTRSIDSWSSATQASPDHYGHFSKIPDSWQAKGFGDQQPHSGIGMAGITLYGCTKGKPHCREYLQVALEAPTVPGQEYSLSFWTAPLRPGLRVNRIGALFSQTKLAGNTDRLLDFSPQLQCDDVVADGSNAWTKVSFSFTADKEYRFLVLGNFFDDGETAVSHGPKHRHGFAYYYIDDVVLKKANPLLEVKDPLADWYPLREGRSIEIKVLFDVDKHQLKRQAQHDLDKLALLLMQYPQMKIEIAGHTDSTGNFIYNMSLSDRRARAVVGFLAEQGIEMERMIANGHGPTQPVASNGTFEGRQLNRRVEFRILEM